MSKKQAHSTYLFVKHNPVFSILLCVFMLVSINSKCFAQTGKTSGSKVMNLPNYDNRLFHFGFLIAINNADFRVRYNENFFGRDTILTIQTSKESGFNLGIITDIRLGEYTNLRFIPSISFVSRNIDYVIYEKKQLVSRSKQVESVFLDFPLLFKYKSERANNFRAYLIAGAKYSIDMASQKDVNSLFLVNDILVKIDKTDFLAVFGVGFDFYLTYFKFSPEITFNYGLKNILVQENNVLTKPIDRLTSKIIQISFNFE